MIQFLPVSRLNQFANLALHQIALENTEMTDVELAVQVISLVEKSAGKQVVAGLLKPLSTHILSTHRNLAGTRDWFRWLFQNRISKLHDRVDHAGVRL